MNKRRTTLIVSGLLVLVGGASLLAYVVRQRRDPSAWGPGVGARSPSNDTPRGGVFPELF